MDKWTISQIDIVEITIFHNKITFYIRLCNVIIQFTCKWKQFIICKSEIKTLLLEHWKSDEKMPNEVFRRRMSWPYFQFWLFLAQINCQISPLKMFNTATRQRSWENANVACECVRLEKNAPRRGIEPRSPAWQAGILTTILSWSLSHCIRFCILNLFDNLMIPFFDDF